MQYIGSPEAAEKLYCKNFQRKSAHFWKDSTKGILPSVRLFKIQCNDLCRTLHEKSCRPTQIIQDQKPGKTERMKLFDPSKIQLLVNDRFETPSNTLI